jgi:hypothetical protein
MEIPHDQIKESTPRGGGLGITPEGLIYHRILSPYSIMFQLMNAATAARPVLLLFVPKQWPSAFRPRTFVRHSLLSLTTPKGRGFLRCRIKGFTVSNVQRALGIPERSVQIEHDTYSGSK